MEEMVKTERIANKISYRPFTPSVINNHMNRRPHDKAIIFHNDVAARVEAEQKLYNKATK